MRWKLASGGIVGTTKQPLQNKDFDRIEVSDNYASYLATYGTFEDMGRPPRSSEISIIVNFYNPSTHTIRKSYGAGFYKLSVGVSRYGNYGTGRLTDTNTGSYGWIDLKNLTYGSMISQTVHPSLVCLKRNYTWLINPFEENWFDKKEKGWLPEDGSGDIPYEQFWPDTYEVAYNIKFLEANHSGPHQVKDRHGGLWHTKRRIQHNITYVIRQ